MLGIIFALNKYSLQNEIYENYHKYMYLHA